MTRTVTTLVVAGNFREFEHWCRQSGVPVRAPIGAGVVYVAEPGQLGGLQGPLKVVRVGTWATRERALLEALWRLEQ